MHKDVTSWIQESNKKAISLEDRVITISAHVLIDKEVDLYTAHCLEFDIVADGQSIKAAANNIIDAIADHVSFCLQTDNIEGILNPAPQEFWTKYYFCSEELPKEKLSPKLNKDPLRTLIKDVSFRKSSSYAYA